MRAQNLVVLGPETGKALSQLVTRGRLPLPNQELSLDGEQGRQRNGTARLHRGSGGGSAIVAQNDAEPIGKTPGAEAAGRFGVLREL